MQDLSKFFAVCVLGACAAQNNAAVHHGTGSGSDDGSDGMDAGVGSGSSTGSGSGSATPPPPGTLYGTVFDERNDKIDFSTGEPVHTHQGATIDLGQGCPAVYKYAYLEDAADPAFGSQTNANPLEWFVKSQVGSLDDSATAYRVRLDDGTVALDWTTAAAPDGNGVYALRLYRNGSPSIAQLGDHTGKMYVDMRFRDTSGNETIDTACWENHPMAAPLEVQPVVQADLFGWTLAAHSPISTAINTAAIDGGAQQTVGASLFTQSIVQHTAEPVTLGIDHTTMGGNASNQVVPEAIVISEKAEVASCFGIDQYLCNPFPTAPPASTSQAVLFATFDIRVIDAASGAIMCHNPDAASSYAQAITSCTLPARAATEPPHAYTLIYSMNDANTIAPYPGMVAGENSLRSRTGRVYQGTLSATQATGCAASSNNDCTEEYLGDIAYFLDAAHIDFNAFTVIVQSQPDLNATLESLGDYATPSLSVPAQSWDAGNGGF